MVRPQAETPLGRVVHGMQLTLSSAEEVPRSQVLKALAFLHSLDLIHSDLKPENILIKSYSRCAPVEPRAVSPLQLCKTVYNSRRVRCYSQTSLKT